MSDATELVLTTFEPALDELARRVDSGSDPAGTVNAALALFQGIAATAMLPGGIPGIAGNTLESRWDGVFEDGRLRLIRPGYQFSASLGMGLLQSAILNGPATITWSVLRSEKGLHITVKSPAGGTLHDLFIGLTGETRDERDTAGKLRRIKEEFDEINRRPIESLPHGKPAGGTSSSAGSVSPDFGNIGELFGQATKGAAVAAAGAAMAAAAGAAARAAAGPETGKKAGPPAPPPPPPAPKPETPAVAPPRPSSPAVIPAPRPVSVPVMQQAAPIASIHNLKLVFRLPDGRTLDTPSYPAVIGRSEGVEIRLDSTRVSRRHAQLDQDANGFWLTDLGSANGSFRNDVQLISRTHLENGDRLRFADILLNAEIEGGPISAVGMATTAFQVPEELRSPPPPRPPQPPPAGAKSSTCAPLPPIPTPTAPPIPEQRISAASVKTPCPACGHHCPPEAAFCRACGAPLNARISCSACGNDLKPADTFCEKCGNPVSAPQIRPDGTQPAESVLAASSLRMPGFLFGLFFTVRLISLAAQISPNILFLPPVLLTIVLGYSTSIMAFITGTGGGISRFTALLLTLAYCYNGFPRFALFAQQISANPERVMSIGPVALSDAVCLLLALWILRRSCRFPK